MAGEHGPALRISDAERERAVRTLGEHHAVGRLTYDEFVERMDRAYDARTHDELDVLTADLPEVSATPGAPAQKRRWFVSVLGGAARSAEVAPGHTVVLDVMGGTDLDLRAATFPGGEVTITAIAIMGGSTIRIPEGARVELSGFAFMGGNDSDVVPAPGGSGPLIRIKAWSLMGGIDVRTGAGRGDRKLGLPPPRL